MVGPPGRIMSWWMLPSACCATTAVAIAAAAAATTTTPVRLRLTFMSQLLSVDLIEVVIGVEAVIGQVPTMAGLRLRLGHQLMKKWRMLSHWTIRKLSNIR
jgi:hypothetical protein